MTFTEYNPGESNDNKTRNGGIKSFIISMLGEKREKV